LAEGETPRREIPLEARRLFDQGATLQRAGRNADALAVYENLLRAFPDYPGAFHNIGICYRGLRQFEAGIAALMRAVEEAPANAQSWSSLGNILKDAGRLDEALAAHERAVALAPQLAGVHQNQGVALREAGMLREALAALDRCLAIDADRPEARWDRALTLLFLEDYEAGWKGYEERWTLGEHKPATSTLPKWDGSPQPDKGLVLTTEQGYGDALMFVRFCAEARKRVGKVVLACKPELHRLFRTVPGVDLVMPESGKIAGAHLHAQLLSLPMLLGHRFSDLPGPMPYLFPPVAPNPRLAQGLARGKERFKVGIVWSGSVSFKGNATRRAPLDRFLRFAEIPGVQLFSLQKRQPADELKALKGETLIADLGPALEDFADAAAAAAEMDLILMTDSAMAHLGGALGRPVWVLLQFAPDWRWFRDRADSPWYPTLRLFRQPRPGDWDSPFEAAHRALAERVAAWRAEERSPNPS